MTGGESWDDVLKRMSPQGSLPNIDSKILKYEYIIFPLKDKIKVPWTLKGRPFIAGGRMLGHYASVENHIVKRGVCRELKKHSVSPYYAELTQLNASYYITTNYETLLNDEFEKQGYTRAIPPNDRSRLYARDVLTKNNQSVSLWNIHGNWVVPETIMLGIKDYCEYIAEINNLISEGENENRLSWVNLFLKTDVHFVGFGLSYEEIDLWYVLTLRKRMMRQENTKIHNHITYYVINKYADVSKNELLETMDVEVVIIPSQKTEEDTNIKLFEELKRRIGIRHV